MSWPKNFPSERGGTAAYRARWVFTGLGSPLENATVEVDHGRIAAVHQRFDPQAVDLGNAAVIPGLVNAHTHLEFSQIQRPVGPSAPFTAWLQAVIAERQAAAPTDRPAAIAQGLAECAAEGTTSIGEIASAGETAGAVAAHGPQVTAFLELLGLRADRHDAQLDLGRRFLESAPPHAARARRGLSPHAPYSVHPRLFASLVALALEYKAPLAMHLAESPAEVELLSQTSGAFVPFLRNLGVWEADAFRSGMRTLDYLRRLAELDHALVIHGNYLDEEEIDFLSACPNLSVVYCPRTHAYFGHRPHPWQRLLECGVRVALGTDSRASNPDLSVWSELLYLRRVQTGFDPARLLQMATAGGAAALGLSEETGSISVGKWADLAVISLEGAPGNEPYRLLFGDAARPMGTLCAGEPFSRLQMNPERLI